MLNSASPSIKVGLLGRGMAATVFHAPLIRATTGLELAAMAGSADAASMLSDGSIDLVVIATPNDTHFDLARTALERGKHVVVDKPLVTTVAEVDQLIDLARSGARLLTVFQNRRWDGDFLTVCDLLRERALGDLLLFEAHWDRFRPRVPSGWREGIGTGAGTLWNHGPHLIDQILVLLGMPQAVQADIEAQRNTAQVDDYFSLTFYYGRARVVVGASNLVASPRPRFSLHGTAGSFLKYGLDPQEASLRSGIDPRTPGFGAEQASSYGQLTSSSGAVVRVETRSGNYLAFYEGVVTALTEGAPAPVELAEVRAGVQLAEACLKSSQSGERIRL